MEEVLPNFVMAALICVPDAQHVERDFEGSMHADLPLILGTRRFQEPTHIHLARLLVPTKGGARWNR